MYASCDDSDQAGFTALPVSISNICIWYLDYKGEGEDVRADPSRPLAQSL